MKRLSSLVALLLMALWLPATLHCQLEGVGLDTLFNCAAESDHDSHADQAACLGDGCQLLESGQYAFSKSRVTPDTLPIPHACLFACCLLQLIPSEPVSPLLPLCQSEPLLLQRTWQFTQRAALPARAPDNAA